MGELEALLSKYNFTGEVDAKEFLNKLLFDGNSQYLDQFRSSFNENFLFPTSEKFKKLYTNINKRLDKMNEKEIDKIVDPFKLSNIAEEYKSKIEDFKKRMTNFLDKKIENNEENTNAKKNGNFLDSIGENISKILPSSLKEAKQEEVGQEQKSFGPKENIITFSEKTTDFFKEFFLNTFTDNLIKKFAKIPFGKPQEDKDKKDSSSFLSSLVIGALLSDIVFIYNKLKSFFTSTSEFLDIAKLKVKNLWEFFETKIAKVAEDTIEIFSKSWEKVDKIFDDGFEILKEKWSKVTELFEKGLSELKTNWGKFGESTVEFFEKSGKKITEITEATAESSIKVGDLIGETWSKIIGITEKVSSSVIEFFDSFTSKVGKTFDGVVDSLSNIPKLFSEDGIFGKIVKQITSAFEIISKIIGPIIGPIEKLFTVIGKIGGVLGKILTLPVMMGIEGGINAYRTYQDVKGDEKMGFGSKLGAVGLSFGAGMADIVPDTARDIADVGTGVYNLTQGKGFDTKNAFSEWLNKQGWYGEGKGMGVAAGKSVQELSHSWGENETPWSNLGIGLKEQGKEFLKSLGEGMTNNEVGYGVYDASFGPQDIKALIGNDNKRYYPDNKDTITVAKPDGGINKSFEELKGVMMNIHKEIILLNKNQKISAVQNYSSINVGGGGKDSSSYFGSGSRDPIYNARLEWWKISPLSRA